LKFSNEATWTTRDDDEIPLDLELVAVDIQRVVQRWEDQRPVETIILEPGQKFSDIETMNEKVPRSEWSEGPDGQLRGPWQAQHILYLVDLTTMDKYTFPTGTVGGRRAVGELRDKLVWMRRLRGPNVYPVVPLSDTFMKTRFGGRQRPHFKIVRWVRLGGEGGEVKALPPPPATQTLAQQTTAPSDVPLVPEPSAEAYLYLLLHLLSGNEIRAAVNTCHILHRDIETRAAIDLADVGAWRYAGDPMTGV